MMMINQPRKNQLNNFLYLLLGGFILLGIVGAFAIPVSSDLPPTPAFKIINATDGNNVTARTYSDFVTFEEGTGITIAPDYSLNKITFSATGGGSPNELYCFPNALGNYNETTKDFECVTIPTSSGDGLGNHTAFTTLDLNTNYISIKEVADPGTPPSDTVYLFAFDTNGNTRLRYNVPDGTEIQIARDNYYIARNTSGSDINKCDVVYVTGSTGQKPNIDLAKADSSNTLPATGYAGETISNNGFGRVMFTGVLSGCNTSGMTEGDNLWVSDSTEGDYTTTKPDHPNLSQRIGTVLNEHATQGVILVSLYAIRGDHEGTNLDSWQIGDNISGKKYINFRNGFNTTLSAQPNANYEIKLPNNTGTIALLSDISGSGEANTQSSPTHANSLVLAKSGVDLPIKGIACGTGTSCAANSTDVTISASGLSDGDKGDITVSGSGATWTIDNNVVTYAKMQDVSATSRFLGRITGGSGDTEELTGTQATTLLDTFTSVLKGLVPLSGGGTTNFLRADGTWAAPPSGSGGPTVLGSDVTCTATATYCNVFTVPLTASSGNYLNVQLIGDSNTAGSAIQMRVQFDNAGNTGYCLYRTFTTATAEVLDNLAATTTTDTGETVWLAAANVPMPLTIDCGFETDASPGNAIVQIQMEVASTGTIQKGSYYIKTP